MTLPIGTQKYIISKNNDKKRTDYKNQKVYKCPSQ